MLALINTMNVTLPCLLFFLLDFDVSAQEKLQEHGLNAERAHGDPG